MHLSLAVLTLLAAAPQDPAAGLPDTSKMNVLLIDIEDCNAAALGCYGNPICKTPNLDRFCRTAVRFDAAYVQAVCCNPSRTSFLTGLRPLTTRVTSNGHVMDEHLPPGVLTLPEMLKARGLYLADVGKLFHKLEYAEKRLAVFDRLEMHAKPADWNGPGPVLKFPPAGRGSGPGPAPRPEEQGLPRLEAEQFRPLWRFGQNA